jgi:hypothetical protein
MALGAVRRARQVQGTTTISPAPSRTKPASERTRELPKLSSFDELRAFLKENFTPKEYKYRYWIAPEELCDIVEEYAELIDMQFDECSSDRSEDFCIVSFVHKSPPDGNLEDMVTPEELEGLFPFPSTADAARFVQQYHSSPEYLKALPRLAGIKGRYQFNFCGTCRGNTWPRSIWYREEKVVSPAALWPKIWARRERFSHELEL